VIALFAESLFGWEAHEYFRLIGIRGAAMLCIGYIITRLMKEQRAQREQLRATNAELHRLGAVREQLATSRERNRVARELHDTLAHTLTGLAVQLEAIRTVWENDAGEAHDLLEKAHARARSGLVETRRALAALRASPLDSVGLAGAVRALAEKASARGGLRLELVLPEGEPELDEDDAQALYRVAQEALENVVRHAEARRVSVSLKCPPFGATLVVADDGRGFDLERCASVCWGLAGMRERAEARGAVLDVESRPGAGTVIRLRLGPCAAPVAEKGV
jgi:signal transduction histidine kinase